MSTRQSPWFPRKHICCCKKSRRAKSNESHIGFGLQQYVWNQKSMVFASRNLFVADNKCMFAYIKGCSSVTSYPSNAWTTRLSLNFHSAMKFFFSEMFTVPQKGCKLSSPSVSIQKFSDLLFSKRNQWLESLICLSHSIEKHKPNLLVKLRFIHSPSSHFEHLNPVEDRLMSLSCPSSDCLPEKPVASMRLFSTVSFMNHFQQFYHLLATCFLVCWSKCLSSGGTNHFHQLHHLCFAFFMLVFPTEHDLHFVESSGGVVVLLPFFLCSLLSISLLKVLIASHWACFLLLVVSLGIWLLDSFP